MNENRISRSDVERFYAGRMMRVKQYLENVLNQGEEYWLEKLQEAIPEFVAVGKILQERTDHRPLILEKQEKEFAYILLDLLKDTRLTAEKIQAWNIPVAEIEGMFSSPSE